MRLPLRCSLVCASLVLGLATARPAFAQGGLYGTIETPAYTGTATPPFEIRGWVFWSGATSGSGIDAVQIYGCPSNCQAQTLWGAATIGLSRPDVLATYGFPAAAHSGFSFPVAGLAPDTYYVTVKVHNVWNGAWQLFTTQFTVTAVPEHVLEHPTPNQALTQPFTISGWAIDANAPTGTGVDIAASFAYPHVGSGEAPVIIGQAVYGDARPDVAAARGQRFLNSGYHLAVSGQSPGEYMFVVSTRSTTPGNPWTAHNINVTIDTPTVALTVNRSGTGTGAVTATGLTCPGGSNTQAMPCGASYALNTTVTLTAVPDAGSTFAGWSGACQTTQPACTVTLTGTRDVFATFTQTGGAVATTYYHTDAIGSVRALSDQTGVTVLRHDYLPFGEDTQPLTGDPLRFAGKELDPESALMNFEARYYRNTWGRFTQVDPVSGSLTDPQSWNRYAYARNSPLTFVDPSGREPFRVIIWGHQKIGDGCNDIDGTEWCNSGGGILGACADILSLSCDIALAPPLRQLPNPIGIRFPKPMPSHGKDGDNNGGGDGNHTDGSDGGNNNHHDPDPNKPCDSPPAPPGVDLDRNISAAKTVSAQGGALGWPWLKYMWFAEMSDTGGPFDFKKGGHQEFQDYGNWHYGVLGAALHIPENVLFRAAGYVQWRNRGPNYDPAWGVPWGSAPYGDDPERDVPWIATGYNYYKSCKN